MVADFKSAPTVDKNHAHRVHSCQSRQRNRPQPRGSTTASLTRARLPLTGKGVAECCRETRVPYISPRPSSASDILIPSVPETQTIENQMTSDKTKYKQSHNYSWASRVSIGRVEELHERRRDDDVGNTRKFLLNRGSRFRPEPPGRTITALNPAQLQTRPSCG